MEHWFSGTLAQWNTGSVEQWNSGICRGEYCGETGVDVNNRMNLHRDQIEDSLYRKMRVFHHIPFIVS